MTKTKFLVNPVKNFLIGEKLASCLAVKFAAFPCFKDHIGFRAFKGIIKLFWLSAKKLFCIGINDQRGTGNQMGTICCER